MPFPWTARPVQMWLPQPTRPPCRELPLLLIGRVYLTGPTPGWSSVNVPLAMRLPYRPIDSPKYGPPFAVTGGLS